jgi:hypothetical protein
MNEYGRPDGIKTYNRTMKYVEKSLFQCHYFHYKTHKNPNTPAG